MTKFKKFICTACATIFSAILIIPTTIANEDYVLKIEKSYFPGYNIITVSKNGTKVLNCFSDTDYINKLAQKKFKLTIPYSVFCELNSIEPITIEDLEYIQYLCEETDPHRGIRNLTDEEIDYFKDIHSRNMSTEKIISKLDCSSIY